MQKGLLYLFVILFVFLQHVITYANISSKPLILTSITPLASIVSMLVGDSMLVEALSVTTGCPHHLSAKLSDRDKVKNADISIYVDDNFDNFAAKLINNYGRHGVKISNMPQLRIIDDNSQRNWHIWLDLTNVQVILQQIADIITHKFPQFASLININLRHALDVVQKLSIVKNLALANMADVILLSDSVEYFFIDSNVRVYKLYQMHYNSLQYMKQLRQLIINSKSKCVISDNDMRLLNSNDLLNNFSVIILDSENWQLHDHILERSFYNKYLKIIEKIQKCAHYNSEENMI